MKPSAIRWLASLLVLCGCLSADEPRKPNLVLILADDLGYEAVGANGGTSYRTPTLDKLASTGARFTQCYAQPLCTPTRVQLMTGLSNARNYINFWNVNPKAVTFANLLKAAGYATCIAGKWGIGRDVNLPKKLGFDEYYLWRHTRSPSRYANPGLEINGVERDYTNGEYGPDVVNDYALDFITRKKDGPFLLYYSMLLVHAPYQPTPHSDGWDPRAKGERENQAEEHFGDMVEYMDMLVGKLVARLDALGIRDNTLIVFLGDNGTGRGVHSMMGDREVVGGKGRTIDAGMHVPLIANWPNRVAAGEVHSDLVDTTDFLPTLLEAAGAKAGPRLKLDGRSFLPQLEGERGNPREWIYSWYSPRLRPDLTVRDFAFDRRFKLYRSGEFFDRRKDPEEQRPLDVGSLSGEAAAAARKLQGALDEFRGVRSADLDRPRVRAHKGKRKANKNPR